MTATAASVDAFSFSSKLVFSREIRFLILHQAWFVQINYFPTNLFCSDKLFSSKPVLLRKIHFLFVLLRYKSVFYIPPQLCFVKINSPEHWNKLAINQTHGSQDRLRLRYDWLRLRYDCATIALRLCYDCATIGYDWATIVLRLCYDCATIVLRLR